MVYSVYPLGYKPYNWDTNHTIDIKTDCQKTYRFAIKSDFPMNTTLLQRCCETVSFPKKIELLNTTNYLTGCCAYPRSVSKRSQLRKKHLPLAVWHVCQKHHPYWAHLHIDTRSRF